MHVLHAHEEECTKQREHSFHFFPHICTYIFSSVFLLFCYCRWKNLSLPLRCVWKMKLFLKALSFFKLTQLCVTLLHREVATFERPKSDTSDTSDCTTTFGNPWIVAKALNGRACLWSEIDVPTQLAPEQLILLLPPLSALCTFIACCLFWFHCPFVLVSTRVTSQPHWFCNFCSRLHMNEDM